VSGINDDFAVSAVGGTCTTCHDAAHAGDHSVPAPLNIGIADPPVNADGTNAFGLPVSDMPVYTLRHKQTGALKVVTDPGRALITGKWKDIGRFKGPILRGLAVSFDDRRFELNLTPQQKDDLVAFLRSL